jgi:hypothetical protein
LKDSCDSDANDGLGSGNDAGESADDGELCHTPVLTVRASGTDSGFRAPENFSLRLDWAMASERLDGPASLERSCLSNLCDELWWLRILRWFSLWNLWAYQQHVSHYTRHAYRVSVRPSSLRSIESASSDEFPFFESLESGDRSMGLKYLGPCGNDASSPLS